MDPITVTGLASSVVAIVDGIKEAYRFGRTVIHADEERKEFDARLSYVETFMDALKTLIASETKAQSGQNWLALIDPSNVKSPVKGLELAISRLNEGLQDKAKKWRQKMRNFEWPSEKKTLEQFFLEINGCCTSISAILVSANISLSRETFTVAQLTNTTTMETNLITKTLALKFEEERVMNRLVQEENRNIRIVEEWRREQALKKEIESWLSPFDFQARRSEKCEGAAKTGQFFLESPEFTYWMNGEVHTLRCFGSTGAGKTILSAIVSQYLVTQIPADTPVLNIFFEQKPSFPQSPSNVLGSLLKQLMQLRPHDIPSSIQNAHQKATRISSKLTRKELEDLLETEIQTYTNVFIIIDALDEASGDSRNLVERYLRKLSPNIIKLMTTEREDVELSREKTTCNVCKQDAQFYYQCPDCPQNHEDHMDVCQSCQNTNSECPANPTHKLTIPKFFEMEIRTPNEDIASFVTTTIRDEMPPELSEDDPGPALGSKLGRECEKDPALLQDIVDAIVKASKGRFLLAKQYIRSVGSKQNLGAIRKALRKLEIDRYSLSESIDLMYEEDMNIRIKKQGYEERKVAWRILQVVSTARRNLSLKELQHALATWKDDEDDEDDEPMTDYDPAYEIDRQEILNRTKGLIRIDRDSEETVRLDHRTLEEYFDKTRARHFPTASTDMTKICLTYLNFDEFSKPCTKLEDFSEKEESHCFISYAVQYWGDHLRDSMNEESSDFELVNSAVKYLQNPLRLEAYVQAGWASNTYERDKWDVRRNIYPLHVCAWFDLTDLISALDFQDLNLDVREKTYGQTALMYACRRGNVQVARRLMELGASLNLVSDRGRTALFEAVLNKHEEVVELLLSPEFAILESDVNECNRKLCNRTPLMVAAHRGQLGILHRLIGHPNISVNIQDSEGNTALYLASAENHIDIVTALMDVPGLRLDIQETRFGRTALSRAAERDHAEIVELLLSQGANPDLKDMRGGYAALRAAAEGSSEALSRLLMHNADITQADEDGSTPLHVASGNGHIEVLQIILERYSEIDVRNHIGMTPLHRACLAGELAVARLLLDRGSSMYVEDNFQRTSFLIAWQYGRHDIMSLCQSLDSSLALPQDIQADVLPLWALVVRRDVPSIVTALAANSMDLDLAATEPGTKNTLLHLSIIQNEHRNEDDQMVVRLLRALLPAASICLDEKDSCGRSPLHLAAISGNTEAVRVLLENDPILSEPDRFGETPLAIAFGNGFYSIAAMLVEASPEPRADIIESKIDVQKMLFKAIELQNVKAAEFLVEAGADATIPDEFGRTVTQLAKLSGEKRLMHLAKSIKSSIWQPKLVTSVKANVDAAIKVVEILSEITADQFPPVSQLPILELYVPVSTEKEAIAVCV